MKQFVSILLLLTVAGIFLSVKAPHADDTDLFMTSVSPDALILLDMSGSMNFDPAGNPASYPNRKIDIARGVIFDLLDDNDNTVINATDEGSLNMRLGYMRFRSSANDDDGNPLTGTILVRSVIGSAYSTIWGNVNDSAEYNAAGGTPLAAALVEAKKYFTDLVNPSDLAIACRQKFVIMISDGVDTYACGGDGTETQTDMHRRRMLTVKRAKELYDAGVQVFAVGFGGTVSESFKRTLNWAAKYGGTDNPLETNAGDLGAYDVTAYGDACTTTDLNADPGVYPLSGYAFLATDASQLSQAIKTIAKYIQEKSYSFTAPANPSIRIADKDVVYISSFIPDSRTPYWQGIMKAYRLNEDGTLPLDEDGYPLYSNLIWDASERLKAIASTSRNIYTYVENTRKTFVYANLTNAHLDVSTNLDRLKLINHIRGIDAYDIDQDGNTSEERHWKLGDIFHSNAVVVGEPSRFFEAEGFSGSGGFYEAKKDRAKVILAGANDGMLHAFDATTGDEKWGFIPNSLLKNLKSMSALHTYYVDSSPKAADVWFYSSASDTTKSADEWKTVLISGLRKGGKKYFALDITDTLNPVYLWEFPDPTDAVTLAKVGQSWSEPAIGRVKVESGGELYERWVAFMGGGFDNTDNLGRSFFVIDIKTGAIIWEFSYDAGAAEKNEMIYSLAAPPTMVDTNSDGYVDKVYIGDRGGQMWVFDVSFDVSDPSNKKSNSRWNGRRLFKAPKTDTERHQIYYQPAVAFDRYGIPWVYFGTGDRESPKDLLNPNERFYAVKDSGAGNYPRQESDLLDVTSTNTFSPPSQDGWFINLAKSGSSLEKVLARPIIFNQLVYFTSYTYTENASDPCASLGEAKLYIIEYLSGGGALTVSSVSDLRGTPSARSKKFGVGIPSSPVIRVDSRGKASVIIGSTSGQVYSGKAFSPSSVKEVLYWREVGP